MHSADALAIQMEMDPQGVYLLTWDEISELERALRILYVAYAHAAKRHFYFVRPAHFPAGLSDLLDERQAAVSEARELDAPPSSDSGRPAPAGKTSRSCLLVLLFAEAVARSAGPLLNGYRRPLAAPPGSLLIIRAAEEDAFRRGAPDLASFMQCRRAYADSLLADWRPEMGEELKKAWLQGKPPELPPELSQFPGHHVDDEEFREWLRRHLGQDESA